MRIVCTYLYNNYIFIPSCSSPMVWQQTEHVDGYRKESNSGCPPDCMVREKAGGTSSICTYLPPPEVHTLKTHTVLRTYLRTRTGHLNQLPKAHLRMQPCQRRSLQLTTCPPPPAKSGPSRWFVLHPVHVHQSTRPLSPSFASRELFPITSLLLASSATHPTTLDSAPGQDSGSIVAPGNCLLLYRHTTKYILTGRRPTPYFRPCLFGWAGSIKFWMVVDRQTGRQAHMVPGLTDSK